MRNLVVGVDGSSRDAQVIALACALGAACDASLRLVSVLPRVPGIGRARERAASAAQDAHEALDRARGLAGGRATTTVVEASSPARGLHDAAEEHASVAIVVGHTHHGRVSRLAGVPERLLHGAACAVAVTPAGGPAGEGLALRRLTVAFDATPEAEGALRQALALASRSGGAVRAVGALESASLGSAVPELDVMLTELAAYGSEGLRRSLDDVIVATPGAPAVDMKLAEGDPIDLLVAASRDSDLLVCGTRGSGALAAALLRSVSSRLAHEASCALLAVPRGAPALCRDP